MAEGPKRSFLKTRLGKVVVLGTFALVLLVIVFELACQAYYQISVKAQMAYLRDAPNCYWQRSDNPILGFEMRRNLTLLTELKDDKGNVTGTRRLHINALGVREDTDDLFADKHRIGIIGDSVVFGPSQSQDETLPWLLQQMVDPQIKSVKILNLAESGYSLEQMPELLRQRQAVYKTAAMLFLLNPNDFNLRDTIYEGADSGLYKAYHVPLLKGPWFIRKAVYRLVKGGKGGDHLTPDVGWYSWMWDGCGRALLPKFREMADDAKKGGYQFAVVLYPMRAAFDDKDAPMDPSKHLLAKEYDEIKGYLKAEGIACFELLPAVSNVTPNQWMDKTDHFTPGASIQSAAEAFRKVVLDKYLPPEPKN